VRETIHQKKKKKSENFSQNKWKTVSNVFFFKHQAKRILS